MRHTTQEQIVLHCYGDAKDSAAVEQHLRECGQCRAEFERVQALLREIPAIPVPEPPAYLEQKVWLHLRDRLEEEKPSVWLQFFPPARQVMAAALAVLLIGAFLAGRFWPRPQDRAKSEQPVQVSPQRVVLVAVGDHLQRSQMLLIELMTSDAKDAAAVSSQQQLARNLLEDNRLYRISAQQTGNPAVASLLDDLERVLTEIANAPDADASEVQEIRRRIQSQDLLFKIHVVGSRVQAGANPANQRL
jgi:predicted anti-sigma-YlaC factor YlaD